MKAAVARKDARSNSIYTSRAWCQLLSIFSVVRAVVCFIIYFLLGLFGAARWGTNTNNNLLVNQWGPPAYQGILNILLGIYLALTNPPLVYPVAHILRVRRAIARQLEDPAHLPYGLRKPCI